jgi:uncharacterized protein (TIRG00374 family)
MKKEKYLKYIIAIIPFIWIIVKIEPDKFIHIVNNSSWWTVPLIAVTTCITIFIQGFRWWILIYVKHSNIKFYRAMSFQFIGTFYSIILPTSFSQDIVRNLLISKEENFDTVWASTWICRVFGLMSLFVMSSYGLIQYEQLRTLNCLSIIFACLALMIMFLFLISFSKTITYPFRILFEKLLPEKAIHIITQIRNSIYFYKRKKKYLLIVFLFTLVMNISTFGAFTFALYGITGEFHVKEIFSFLPVIELICIIVPITPNGIGLREFLLFNLFQKLNFSEEQAAVFISLNLVIIICRLLGCFPLIWMNNDISKKMVLPIPRK